MTLDELIAELVRVRGERGERGGDGGDTRVLVADGEGECEVLSVHAELVQVMEGEPTGDGEPVGHVVYLDVTG